MKLTFLKKVRVVFALTFFSAFSILFLDISYSVSEKLSDYIVYFQFAPSLLKFLSAGTLAAAGFIFIVGLTLLFGRVYCSFFCPLGILQDVFSFLGRKLKKRRYAFTPGFNKTRYGILASVVLIFCFGSVTSLILLDPYSNFGRIFTHIFRPVVIGINNVLVFALAKFNVYALHPADFTGIVVLSFLFSVAMLVVLLWMSLHHGRLFCNTVCPVGALLGLFSMPSLFKLRFNTSQCIHCKACERVCKAGCMDLETNTIDVSRCVACYNCLQVCPTNGVEYQWAFKKSDTPIVNDTGKRNFLLQTAAFLVASGASAVNAQNKVEIYKESTVPILRSKGITPPGSGSLDNFMAKCTACHLCVAACPTHVLQPAFLEYGFLGMMQPRMDFKTSYCNYDCVACTRVCPSGAILEQSLETKKQIQLGKAKFVRKNCVVYSQRTDCGACAEHCPTKAVRMVLDPEINKRAPKIDDSICIGCGACEHACPTKPYKSIYVETNVVHVMAKKPKKEAIEEEVDLKEAFPF